MNKFEMPMMELVRLGAEDIICTSGIELLNFTYGNEITTSHVERDLMADTEIRSTLSDFLDSASGT